MVEVNGKTLKLKDTGLDKPDGTELYSKVTFNTDNFVPLGGTRLTSEFTTNATQGTTTRISNGEFSFKNSEVTAVLPPRWQITGLIPASETELIKAIRKLQKTLGIKELTGGLGTISAMDEVRIGTYTPEGGGEDISYDYIYVIVKNITMSEVISNSVDYVNVTIQLEQVA